MKPIIRWTMWQKKWSIIWWSVGVFAFIFINMIFYPTFKNQAAELQKSFESLPKAAVQLFGGSTDFFSPIGFLNSQVYFLMLPLLLGILAIGLGSSLLAREEQDHTIESLLAKPISRLQLLGGKTLAGLAVLSVVTISALLTTLVLSIMVNIDVSLSSILAATLVCFLMSLSYGSVAFMLTALGRARVASLGIASLFAIGGYLVVSLAGTVTALKTPSYAFPFHYYQSEAILRGRYDWANVLFFVAIIVIAAAISWYSFRRRDIS